MREFYCYKTYYVYILFNERAKATYIGVTNDLSSRLLQHRSGEIKGYTQEKKTYKLGYFETHSDINDAIKREKQLKEWKRAWKYRLIETMNPDWIDLSETEN
ncbi:MAG: GIY-YIG nuclease family protein [Alphaproteobacteria bacterium]|nr:GIY-YIG nuclease family protein [Alphaproteobacteria bacterium]